MTNGIVFMPCADSEDVSVFNAGGLTAVSLTHARTGTYSWWNNNAGGPTHVIPAATAYYVRTAVYCVGHSSWIYLGESGAWHIVVGAEVADNTYKVCFGAYNGTVLGSCAAPGGVLTSAWHCIEAYVLISNSVGQVTVKVDGVQLINLSSIDTRNGGAVGTIDRLFWYFGGDQAWMDDICVRDDTWPGAGGNYLLTVTGDGADTAWTPSAGSRYQCVDEIPPSATDYISTDGTVSGTKNLFALSDLPITPGNVSGVGIFVKTKLAAAGTGTVRAIAKSGSTYENGSDLTLSTSEQYATLYMTDDPAGGGWTLSGVNALQAGVESR